jgi:hypothetical protein
LFEVFDHLFNLPAFGIISEDIESRKMEIGGDKITGFLSFFFYHHNGHFAEVLDESNKPSDLKRSLFPIERKRDLSVGRTQGREGCYFRSFPIEKDNGIRPQLRDHMITSCSTELSQRLSPIPAVCQKIDFTGDREMKCLKHLFDQEDFGSKRAASMGPFRVIQTGPEGEKKILIEDSKQDPLVAKDVGLVGSLFMPGASGHLLTCLLGNGVIHDKKEDRMGFDPQMVEKLG